jgi:single-strand DNA-binding protein
MNKVLLIGRLTKDAEVRTLDSGKKLARFCLAVNRRTKSDDHPEADFFYMLAWEKLADLIGQYCHKGDKVGIVGHIQTGKYQDKNGVDRDKLEVVVEEVEFLSERRSESSPLPPEPVSPPAELPFEI